MMRTAFLLAALLFAGPASAQYARDVATEAVNVDGSTAGGSSLPALTDNAGKVLAVNVGETATEWIAVAGTGTVTSVGITAPNIFAVADSPVTAAGTVAITLATQAKNLVWAGPATGADAAPGFRALVAADLGSFTLSPSLRLLTLQDATGDTTPLTVRASSGVGTAPIAQFQASDNSPLSNISHAGAWVGPVTGDVTGDLTGNADTATALAADPAACTTGQYVSDVAANGTLTCGTPAGGGGGVTNGAGANVIPKSDGTNLVASALTESSAGVLVTSAGTALSVTATAPAATTGASQAGKSISMTASPAVASTDTAGAAAGGGFSYTGGAAARNTSGNADGGSFIFTGGAGIGTGKAGTLQCPSPGVASSIAIGPGAAATGANEGIAIGNNATTGTGIALGYTASAGAGNVAAGRGATATDAFGCGVAIGYGANSSTYGSITLGRASTATAANQFVAGSRVTASVGKITDVFFGSGVTNATAESFTLWGTGGSGTDNVGGNVSVASGKGTGSSNLSLVKVYGDALGGTTGTSAHASVIRAVYNLSGKSLTSGAASSLFEIPLTSSPSSGGGQIAYTIRATDGTEEQVSSGTVHYVARRTGAGPTYAHSTTVVNETTSASSGALSTAWAFANGTNKVTLQVTPTSTTITPTLIEIVLEVHSQGRSDIVPLPF